MFEPIKPPPAIVETRRTVLIGTAAALSAVLIWAGWIVATRHAAQTLDISVVALLRYGIPAVVLAALWWRIGLFPRQISPWISLALLAGSGTPYFLAVGYGMRVTSAAEVGPLLPGTMPLFVACLAVLVDHEKQSWPRKFGFALIASGVAAIIGTEFWSSSPHDARGQVLVLGGAMLWAIYTIALRRSGLSAFEAAAFISVWSTISLLPFALWPLIEAFQQGRAVEIGVQALMQGVLSGLVATILFAVAILQLGPSRAAAFAALIPALAALLAIPVLGEIPTPIIIAGILATSFGVALASGAFERHLPDKSV